VSKLWSENGAFALFCLVPQLQATAGDWTDGVEKKRAGRWQPPPKKAFAMKKSDGQKWRNKPCLKAKCGEHGDE